MKALVKLRPEPGLWLEEIAVPDIGENDVLIKIIKTAICGTDVHIYHWDKWAQKNIPVPMTIGHEFVGVVSESGSNVNGFVAGDIVSGEGHIVCGLCRNCMAGRKHLCCKTKGVGVNRPGAFAEYLVIPQSNVWHCDPQIPSDILSILDPLGNATHTALSFDLVGEDVLITGAGPIGIMAAAIAKHAGARYVVVTDMNDYRLDLAKKMGATRVVNITKEKLSSVMKELEIKEGFNIGLEMSGSPDALNTMLDSLSHGGKIALLGIIPQGTVIDWDKVVFNGITIKGIFGREIYETWHKMTSMIQSGVDFSLVITHHYNYKDFEEGFEVIRSGHSGKVILEWNN